MFIKNLLSIVFTLAMPTLGWSQNPNNVDDVAKAILAQTKVTAANLKNMAEAMGNLRGSPYEDADYSALSVEYLRSVNKAMEAFDQGMNNVIYPEAQRWLNRYVAGMKQAKNTPEFRAYKQDLTADTQAQLKRVSQEYRYLAAGVFQTVLGNLPAFVTAVKIDATPELCGSYARTTKQTKKGIEYSNSINFNEQEAVALTSQDWFGNNAAIPNPTVCALRTTEGKDNRNLQYAYYYFRNGVFSVGPVRDQHNELRYWIHAQGDLEHLKSDISAWFDKGGKVSSDQQYVVNPIPLVIEAIKTQWLAKCLTDRCRQLRLADLTQFLTTSRLSFLKPINFEISGTFRMDRYNIEQEYSLKLDAPPIPTDELLIVARELASNLEMVR